MKKTTFIAALILCSLGLSSCIYKSSEDKIGDSVRMIALIDNIGEYVEVTVLESEYTFGQHWVITPKETKFFDENGVAISREQLKAGDKVEILYSGQVMLSYPPKIVARKIIRM